MLPTMVGLYSVLSPATRSNLTDLALILGFIIALAGALAILFKWFGRYISAPFRWFWRRTWGRDERGVWMTPVVRLERWLNGVMQPEITKSTETLLAEVVRTAQDAKIELGVFRRENLSQHSAVEARLEALEKSNEGLTESHHALSERLVAVETALRLRE